MKPPAVTPAAWLVWLALPLLVIVAVIKAGCPAHDAQAELAAKLAMMKLGIILRKPKVKENGNQSVFVKDDAVNFIHALSSLLNYSWFLIQRLQVTSDFTRVTRYLLSFQHLTGKPQNVVPPTIDV